MVQMGSKRLATAALGQSLGLVCSPFGTRNRLCIRHRHHINVCASCPLCTLLLVQGGLPPPLHLEDLWNPQLLFSTATHVQPNTLQLGGTAGSAALLLTGG